MESLEDWKESIEEERACTYMKNAQKKTKEKAASPYALRINDSIAVVEAVKLSDPRGFADPRGWL